MLLLAALMVCWGVGRMRGAREGRGPPEVAPGRGRRDRAVRHKQHLDPRVVRLSSVPHSRKSRRSGAVRHDTRGPLLSSQGHDLASELAGEAPLHAPRGSRSDPRDRPCDVVVEARLRHPRAGGVGSNECFARSIVAQLTMPMATSGSCTAASSSPKPGRTAGLAEWASCILYAESVRVLRGSRPR